MKSANTVASDPEPVSGQGTGSYPTTAQGKEHGRDSLWKMQALAEGYRQVVGNSGTHQ